MASSLLVIRDCRIEIIGTAFVVMKKINKL